MIFLLNEDHIFYKCGKFHQISQIINSQKYNKDERELRSVYYYVFCVVSTLFCFKIRSTDHYCKTTRRAKSRFSINFYPFGFISRRFFSAFKKEVISSLIHDCVYQLVNYCEQTSQLVMLCEQVSANQPKNW